LAIKLRILPRKRNEDDIKIIRYIIDYFGYRPKKMEFFYSALTHRSIEHNAETESNERLEFLGDAVLDAVVAELLFKKFPGNDEGYLTKLKSKVVNRKTLSDIGERMNIRSQLNYSATRQVNVASLEGNAFEALIGAIYLDGGFDTARKCIQNHVLRKFVDLNKLLEEEIDFKSRLIIWCQKKRLKFSFDIENEQHIHGAWEYAIQIKINGRDFGKAQGQSKKQAEQLAAQETLKLLGEI
jgi:ribonuclease-3